MCSSTLLTHQNTICEIVLIMIYLSATKKMGVVQEHRREMSILGFASRKILVMSFVLI